MSDRGNSRKGLLIVAGVSLLVASAAYMAGEGAYIYHQAFAVPPTVIEPMHQTGPYSYSMTVEAYTVHVPSPLRVGSRVAEVVAGIGLILLIAGLSTSDRSQGTSGE